MKFWLVAALATSGPTLSQDKSWTTNAFNEIKLQVPLVAV